MNIKHNRKHIYIIELTRTVGKLVAATTTTNIVAWLLTYNQFKMVRVKRVFEIC